jgi:hypothetical protein
MNTAPPSRILNTLKVNKPKKNTNVHNGLKNAENTAGLYTRGVTHIGKEMYSNGNLYAQHISGSGLYLRNVSNWEYFDLEARTDVFREFGNVSIGKVNTTYKLDVNGAMRITNDLYTTGFEHPSIMNFYKDDKIYLHIDGNTSSVSFNTDFPDTSARLTVNNTVITHNLSINDSLIINGTNTNINTLNMNIYDQSILVHNKHTGPPVKDTGFIIDRGPSDKNAGVIWDEINDQFKFILTNSSGKDLGEINVPVDRYGPLHLNILNADANVTAINFIGNGTEIGEVHQEFSKQYKFSDNGNGLEIDGFFRPILTLTRGIKYLFHIDTTEAVFFSNNNTNDTTLAYNNGVIDNIRTNLDVPPRIVFDVPSDAPNFLYYQSNTTINYGNRIEIVDSKLISNDCRTYVEVERERDNNIINFYTENQSRMIITNEGDIGINNDYPRERFDVNGSILSYGDIKLGTNHTQNLGNESIYWNNVFINQLNITDNTYFRGNRVLYSEGGVNIVNMSTTNNVVVNVTNMFINENGTFININKWLGGDSISRLDSNVSIGRTDGEADLHVLGNMLITDASVTDNVILNNVTLKNPAWEYIYPTVDISYNYGYVGVNVTVPREPLHVVGTTQAQYFIGNGVLLENLPLTKWNGGTNIFYMLGNIGIGLNAPDATVDIDGGINIGNSTSITPIDGTIRWRQDTLKFEGYDGIEWVDFMDIGLKNDNNIWLKTVDNIISTNASVGIGTDDPLEKLHVIGNVSVSDIFTLKNTDILVNMRELNILDGILSTTSDLNRLKSVYTTTEKLDYLNNSIFGIATPNKVLMPDRDLNIDFGNGSLTVCDMIINTNVTLLNSSHTLVINQLGINDSVLTLSYNSNNVSDVGIIIERGTNINKAVFWDESEYEFVLANTCCNNTDENIIIVDYVDLHTKSTFINNSVNASKLIGDGFNLTNIIPKFIKKFIVTENNSVFELDNIPQPNITLIRGQQYKFDVSNISEPFVILDELDQLYLEGVTGNGSNQSSDPSELIFNIPHNARGDLYYGSGDTVGMGNKLHISNTDIHSGNYATSVSINDDDRVDFVVNGANIMSINEDGYVGINTIAPTEQLDIYGGNLKLTGHILPLVSDSYNIGNESLSWVKGYINDLVISNNSLYMNGRPVISTIDGNLTLTVDEIITNVVNTQNVLLTVNNKVIQINKWKGNQTLHFLEGNVGISTSQPRELLDIIGNMSVLGDINCSQIIVNNTVLKTESWSSTINGSIHYNESYVGVNNVNPEYELDIIGNLSSNYLLGNGGYLTGLPLSKWLGEDDIYYEGNISIGSVINQSDMFEINGSITIGESYNIINGTMRYEYNDYQGFINNSYITFLNENNNNTNANIWSRGIIPDDIYYIANVGINTDSPQYTLDIYGNMSIIGNLSINGDVLTALISDINILDGLTTNASELNVLVGNDVNSSDMNLLYNLTSGLAIPNRPLLLDSNKGISLNGGDLTVGELQINNNMIINGNSTIINANNLIVNDTIFILSKQQTSIPVRDSGFIINRTDNVSVGLIWDESLDEFAFIKTSDPNVLTSKNIIIDEYSNLRINSSVVDTAITALNFFGNGTLLTGFSNKWIGSGDIHYTGGNVSINTENTDATLTLNGSFYVTNDLVENDITLKISSEEHNYLVMNGTSLNTGFGIENPEFTFDTNDTVYVTNLLIGDTVSKESILDVLIDNNINSHVNIASENRSIFYLDSVTGNVGINTNNPGAMLEVAGNVTISDKILINTTYSPDIVNVHGITNAGLLYGNGSLIDNLIWKKDPITDTLYILNRNGGESVGYVGINTTDPQSKLDVNGTITGSNFIGNGSQLYDIPQLWTQGINTSYNSGNVSIGINETIYNLDVAGIINATYLVGDGSQLLNLPSNKWIPSFTDVYYDGGVAVHTVESDEALTVNGTIKYSSDQDLFSLNNEFVFNLQACSSGIITDILVVNGTSHNVGVLNSNPEYTLDIDGNMRSNNSIIGNTLDSDATLGILIEDTDTLQDVHIKSMIAMNETTLLMLNTTSGNLGNIYNPQVEFDISGNLSITDRLLVGVLPSDAPDAVQVDGIINATYLVGNGSTIDNLLWIDDLQSGNVYIYNRSGTLSFGNIGINTTTPQEALDISGITTADLYVGNGSQLLDVPTLWTKNVPNTQITDISINTTTVGLVGIGTKTPMTELEVIGSIKVDTFIGDASQITNLNGAKWIKNQPIEEESDIYYKGSVRIGGLVEEEFNVIVNGSTTISIDTDNLQSTDAFNLTIKDKDTQAVIDTVFKIDATSKLVGINTVSPQYNLDVCGSVRASNIILGDHTSSDSILDVDMNKDFHILSKVGSDYNSLLRVDIVNHRVGISVENPQSTLDVLGNVTATGIYVNVASPNGVEDVQIGGSVNATFIIGNGSQLTGKSWTDNSGLLYFSNPDDSVSTGSIGIGTANPAYIVDIIGDVNATGFIGNGAYLTDLNNQWKHKTNNYITDIYYNGSGFIGINTSTPTVELDINGNIIATKFIGDAGAITGIGSTGIWVKENSNQFTDIVYNFGNVSIGVNSTKALLVINGSLVSELDTANIPYGNEEAININSRNVTTNELIKSIFVINTSTQRIGMGVAYPLTDVHVNDDIYAKRLVIGDTSPSAILTVDVDTVSDKLTDIQIRQSTSNVNTSILYIDSTNHRVGICTDVPTVDLDIDGNVSVSDKLLINTIDLSGDMVQVGGIINASYLVGDMSGVSNLIWINKTTVYPVTTTGGIKGVCVGIGTNSPQYELDVIGSIKATQFYGNGALLTDIKSLVWDKEQDNKITNIHCNGSLFNGDILACSLGINTQNPSEAVDVVGIVNATNFIGDGRRLVGLVDNSIWTKTDIVVNENVSQVNLNYSSAIRIGNFNDDLGLSVTSELTTLSLARKYVSLVSENDVYMVAGGESTNQVDIYDGISWYQSTLSSVRGLTSSAGYNNNIYIVGGTTNSNIIDVYDTITGEWTTPTTLANGRERLTVAAVNDYLVVAGGVTSGGNTNNVEIYNISTNTWVESTLAQGAEESYDSEVLGNKVYITGGGSAVSNLVDIYDTGTSTWSVATFSTDRRRQSMGAAYPYIMFAGGFNPSATNLIDIYNDITDKWSTSTLSGTKYYLFAGGSNNKIIFGPGVGTETTIDIFDTVTGLWSYSTVNTARHTWGATKNIGIIDTGFTNKFILGGGEVASSGVNDVDIFEFTKVPKVATVTVGGNAHFFANKDDLIINDGVIPIIEPIVYDDVIVSHTFTTLSTSRIKHGISTVGNKMYFIGGENAASAKLDSIDIYDTDADTWSTTTMTVERNGVTSVVLNNAIYIAGGQTDVAQSNVVEILDTETLTVTNFSTLTIGRQNFTSGKVGNYLIFAGGFNAGVINQIDLYNYVTDTWTTSTLSVASEYMISTTIEPQMYIVSNSGNKVDIFNADTETWSVSTLTITATNRMIAATSTHILVAGGTNGTQQNRVDIYDTVNNIWSTSTLSAPRKNASAGGFNNLVMFAGGQDGSTVNDIDIYNSVTGTWSQSTMNQGQYKFSNRLLGTVPLINNNVRFITAGGFSPGTNSVEIFEFAPVTPPTPPTPLIDVDTTVFVHIISTLPSKRKELASVTVGSKIYYISGRNESSVIVNSIDIYDSATFTWYTTTINAARYQHTAVAYGTNIYIAGGELPATTNNIEIYDTLTDVSTNFGTLSVGYKQLTSATAGNYILFGGGGSSNQIDIFNVITDTWTVSTLTTTVWRADSAVLDNKIYINSVGASNNIDIYDTDTNTWTVATATTTAGTQTFASAGNYLMLAGGEDGSRFNDIDIYNSGTGLWTQSTLSNPSTLLMGGGFSNVIMFAGGFNGGSVYNMVDIFNVNTGIWTHTTMGNTYRRTSDRNIEAVELGNKDIQFFIGGGIDTGPAVNYLNIYEFSAPLPPPPIVLEKVLDTATFTQISTTLSVARKELASATVGNQSYFISGKNASSVLQNTIDIYNGATQTWTHTTLITARAQHTAVAYGTDIYIAGGDLPATTNNIEIFDTLTNTASAFTTLSVAQTQLGSATAGNYILFGGGGTPGNQVDIYNVITDTWTTSTLSNTVWRSDAAALGSKIYFTPHDGFNDIDIFDTDTSTWSVATASVIAGTRTLTATSTHLFIAAGVNGGTFFNEVDIYNSTTNTWSVATLSAKRLKPCGGATLNMAMFAGGDINTRLNVVDIYNTNTSIWTTTTLNAIRSRTAERDIEIVGLPSGNIQFIVGGGVAANAVNNVDIFEFAEYSEPIPIVLEKMYNTTTIEYKYTTLSTTRKELATAVVGNRSYFIGGRDSGASILNTIDIYDATTNLWFQTTMVTGRYIHAAVAYGTDIYIAGGNSGSDTNNIEVFDTLSNTSTNFSTLSGIKKQFVAETAGDYILFGSGGGGSFGNHIDLYNAVTNIWTTATLSVSEFISDGVALGDSIYYTPAGGTNTIDIFNTNTVTWSVATASIVGGTRALAATNTQLFIGGGLESATYLNEVDIYNSETGAWSVLTLGTKRRLISSGAKYNVVMFAGGEDAAGVNNVDIYNTNTSLWIETSLSVVASQIGHRKVSIVENSDGALQFLVAGGGTGVNNVDIFQLPEVVQQGPAQDLDTTNYTIAYTTLSTARKGHASATVGTKSYFFGGKNAAATTVNSVDIYDGETDSWSQTTILTARYQHTAIAYGTNIYIAGGDLPATSNDVELFDTLTLGSSSFSTLAAAHSQLGSAVTGDYIVFGGGGTPGNQVDIYNVVTDTWAASTLEATIWRADLAALNSKVYFAPADNSNVIEILDPSTITWTQATMSIVIQTASSITSADPYLFVGGGGTTSTYNVIDIYNSNTNVWIARTLSSARKQILAGAYRNVVMFAGGDINTQKNELDIYNTLTDTWISSTMAIPTKRISERDIEVMRLSNDHVKFILAGGFSDADELNTVEIYDFVEISDPVPITVLDTTNFTQTFTTMSVQRNEMATASIGTNVYFISGKNSSSVRQNTIDIYNAETKVWTHTTLITARTEHTALVHGTDIYIAGGELPADTNNIEVFDTLTLTSTSFSTLSAAHSQLSSAKVGNYLIFAGGGSVGNHVDLYNYSTDTWTSSTLTSAVWRADATTLQNKAYFHSASGTNEIDIFDSDTNTWAIATATSLAGARTSVATYPYVMIAGGVNGGTFFNEVDIYNVETDTWSLNTLSIKRQKMIGGAYSNVVMFAGGDINTKLNVIDIYNTNTSTWSTSTLSTILTRSSSRDIEIVELANKSIQFIIGGGSSTTNASNHIDIINFTEAQPIIPTTPPTVVDPYEIYDERIISHTFGTLSTSRIRHRIETIGRKIYFIGGQNAASAKLDTIDIYDTDTDIWTVTTMSIERNGPTTVVLNDTIYIAGGQTDVDQSNTIEVFYPNTTSTVNFSTLTLGRQNFTSGKAGNYLIFAGGFNAGATNLVDLYNYNTNTWSTSTISIASEYMISAVVEPQMYIVSNSGNKVDIFNATTESWSVSTLSITATNRMIVATTTHILVAGGTSGTQQNRVDIYDTVNDVWSTSTLSAPRKNASAGGFKNLVMFAGGQDGSTVNNVDIYNSDTGTWSQSTMNQGQYKFSNRLLGTVPLINGNVKFITAGGFSPATNQIEMYEFTEYVVPVYTTGSEFNIFSVIKNSTLGTTHLFNVDVSSENVGIKQGVATDKLDIGSGNLLITNGDFIVDSTTLNVPDYVFEPDYSLMSLQRLQQYIKKYKHLPGIASQQEIRRDGININTFNMALLEKTEELVLYTLQQQEKLDNLLELNNNYDVQITELEIEQDQIAERINNLN